MKLNARQRVEAVYHRTLDFFRYTTRNYKITFNPDDPADKWVLADLARFCRANQTTYETDPRLHALVEGRREVWLRIERHIRLSSEQIYALMEFENAQRNHAMRQVAQEADDEA